MSAYKLGLERRVTTQEGGDGRTVVLEGLKTVTGISIPLVTFVGKWRS